MFDFQKEVIINSNVLEDGVTPRFKAMTGAVNLFRVLRCADYRKEGLIDGIVYKTMYNKGAAPSATFNVPTVAGIYRVIVGFSLDGRYLSDYAYPWYKFGKPVMAEFELDNSNLAKAQEIMIKAIEMAIPENYRFARITKEGSDKVKVSGTDSHQIIKVAELQKVVSLACPADACHEVEYQLEAKAVVEKNIMEVGTAAWIQENLRFPSYPNLRYDALNEEEYPVKGGLYVQYSFGYCSPRRGLHGQGTVGQALKSITTHTFYVLSSLVDKFEAGLKAVFGADSIKTISPDINNLIKIEFLNNSKISIADITDEEADIKVNVSGPAINGDATNFVELSIKGDNSKYEIDNEGKLTVKAEQSAAVGDLITIVASYGGATAEKDFTVGA
jgi:hypothetical protein